MLPEIEIFIKDAYTPEIQQNICKAFELFDKLTDDDYAIGYVELLMLQDCIDLEDRFHRKLMEQITSLATSFEISFYDDDNLLLGNILTILEAITEIDAYEDKDSVAAAIESGEDTVDSLAQVLNITANIEVGLSYAYIENVSPALIKKIKEVNKAVEAPTLEEDQSFNNRIVILKRVRKYLTEVLSYPNPIGLEIIEEGVPLYCSFSTYLPYVKNRLDIPNPIHIAYELFFLFHMTSDASQNPLEFFRNNSGLIFDDIIKITKVDVELGKLINSYVSATTKAPQANGQN